MAGVAKAALRDPPSAPARIYETARATTTRSAREDQFTAHVLACALAIGLNEASRSVAAAIGLARDDLYRLVDKWAPGARRLIAWDDEPESIAFNEDEAQLRALLRSGRADVSDETNWLTDIIARRALAPRHLWQDLGLFDRRELGRLMNERFTPLASRNVANMRWKKFFYRSLCELEGFILCAAPTCVECADFDDCFGDETGESALARLARESSMR